MRYVAKEIFDKAREHFNIPIAVSSFYRSKELNNEIGGSVTSQHVTGQAIDIDGDILGGVENCEIFDYIYENLEFDQLIWEYGDKENPAWVHVSLKKDNNRKQVIFFK